MVELQEADYLHFLLGKYIAFAVNDPKKYPRSYFLDKLGEEKVSRTMTPEQMEEVARRISSKLSKK